MSARVKVGQPAVRPDAPSHIARVKQGNATGNYDKQVGHDRDGKSDARRSTGINPKSANPILPTMPNLSPA